MHYWLYQWIPNGSLKGKHGRQKVVSLLGKYSIHDGIALIMMVDNHIYYLMSNARDTTNFTTKCLQTDMTSYMEVTHK